MLKRISILVLTISIVGHLILIAGLKERKRKPVQPAKSIKEQVILIICKDEYIASVIARHDYAYELTAIAKLESDFRPQIKGDNGKSKGMYQIQERIHGRFGDTVDDQTGKAVRVFESFVSEHGYEKAFERYNGCGSKARLYRKMALRLVKQMEQQEMYLTKAANKV